MRYGIIPITLLLLLGGCTQPVVENTNTVSMVKQTYTPAPLQEQIKLKEVDDTNFNTAYMYPEDKKKKEKINTPVPTAVVATDTMDKAECIAMITQEKFDKYTAIFGSETASIKRCKMLKSIR